MTQSQPTSPPVQTHELVVLKPKPTPAEISEMQRRYYDLHAGSYDQLELSVERRRKFAEAACAFVVEGLQGLEPCTRLLSVGCGTGRKEQEIAEALGRSLEIVGIEPSSQMATLSRAAGLSVHLGTLDTFPGSATFDAGMFFYSLPTLATEELRLEALKQLRSHLRLGARLFVDVEPSDDQYGWAPEVAALYERENLRDAGYDPGDFLYRRLGTEEVAFWHFFSEEELTALLEKAGFQVLRRRYIGFFKRPGEIVERGKGTLIVEAEAV